MSWIKLPSFQIWILIADGSIFHNTHPAHINGQTERRQHHGTFHFIYLDWSVQPSETARGGGSKLSRRNHKEHLPARCTSASPRLLCNHFCCIFSVMFFSVSLDSYTILFSFCMHKNKDQNKSQIFLDFFLYTVQDFRQKTKKANNPNRVMGNWSAIFILPPYQSQMGWRFLFRLPL